MTSPERTFHLGDDPTIPIPTIGLLLLLVARWTIPFATRGATRDVSDLPAIGQVDLIGGPLAIAGHKVIIGVSIGVATEATDGTSVGLGEEDTGIAVPVEAHP